MTDKSFVAIGVDICPICYAEHNETVLLDRRLKDSLPSKVRTSWSLCPKHEAMKAEYVALIEVSNTNPRTPDDAKPTGNYLHVRRSVAAQIFNVPLPDDIPFAYMGVGVLDALSSKIDDQKTQGEPDGRD